MADGWYYVDATGGQAGPVAVPDLKTLLVAGDIAMTTHVWCDGQGDWSEINDLPALKRKLAPRRPSVVQTPPPPPPSAPAAAPAAPPTPPTPKAARAPARTHARAGFGGAAATRRPAVDAAAAAFLALRPA